MFYKSNVAVLRIVRKMVQLQGERTKPDVMTPEIEEFIAQHPWSRNFLSHGWDESLWLYRSARNGVAKVTQHRLVGPLLEEWGKRYGTRKYFGVKITGKYKRQYVLHFADDGFGRYISWPPSPSPTITPCAADAEIVHSISA